MISFSRIDDSTWGIRAEEPVATGQNVIAVRKDGTRVPVTVGQIRWTRNGVTLAEIDRGGGRKAAKPVVSPPPVPGGGDDDIDF